MDVSLMRMNTLDVLSSRHGVIVIKVLMIELKFEYEYKVLNLIPTKNTKLLSVVLWPAHVW